MENKTPLENRLKNEALIAGASIASGIPPLILGTLNLYTMIAERTAILEAYLSKQPTLNEKVLDAADKFATNATTLDLANVACIVMGSLLLGSAIYTLVKNYQGEDHAFL